MDFIYKIIKFLSGKKAIIASILGAIEAYLAAKGIIGEAEVVLISAIITAIFGSAAIVTKKAYATGKIKQMNNLNLNQNIMYKCGGGRRK